MWVRCYLILFSIVTTFSAATAWLFNDGIAFMEADIIIPTITAAIRNKACLYFDDTPDFGAL